MLPRRWAGLVGALAALALLPVAGASAGPDRHERFTGHDGLEHESAPLVVTGLDGDLFLGLELDVLCEWGGEKLETGMRRLARLARLIERSGRRVVFTIAPVKAMVDWENVAAGPLPHGDCTRDGMRKQSRVLDTFPDPRYLPLRRTLVRDDRQTYWRTDNHWTTVGGSDWAVELAEALDPTLARRLRFRKTPTTMVGYLNRLLGVETPETAPGLRYAGQVKVRTAPDSPEELVPGAISVDHRWNSRPAAKTWPGQTLLIGDSFALVTLELIRPLFRHGRYVWTGNVPLVDIAEGIARADTVVIEAVQMFSYRSPLGRASFRRMVAQAISKHG